MECQVFQSKWRDRPVSIVNTFPWFQRCWLQHNVLRLHNQTDVLLETWHIFRCVSLLKKVKVKVKVAHSRLPSVGFRSWSRFLAVSLQVMWVINPAVGCHYFPPGPQLPPQPLRGLLPILLLGEREGVNSLRFEPRPFCAWVQHANHSATVTAGA